MAAAGLTLAAMNWVPTLDAQQTPPPRPALQDTPYGRPAGEGKLTMALVGDAVITQRLSPFTEPRFLGAIELIRNADIAFANLEMLFHDYEPPPAADGGRLGTYLRADPLMARELAWAGFDMLSLANDHSGDYGEDGMRLTRRYVEEAGMLTAGTGEDLREAREARFLERHNGRVALVAASATFTAHSTAGPPRGGVRGRPGLNPLRVTGLGPRMLDSARLETLRAALTSMGQDVTPAGQPLNAFGVALAPGSEADRRGTPNANDMREIGDIVRNAAGLSDYVVVSIHAHDHGRHLQTFAHAMIDAGAGVVVGHGPHRLAGIEIYNGKPIFYSLGDFIFQDESILRLPNDAYVKYGLGADATVADFNSVRRGHETSDRESVIAVPTFEGGKLISLELHPIALAGADQPLQVRGRPMLADRQQGRRIIERVIANSAGYGTSIMWDDARGVGVVRVPVVPTPF